MAGASRTALRWWIAVELRRLRDRAGRSRADAARAIQTKEGHIGHLETARSLPDNLQIRELLGAYGVSEQVDLFCNLRAQALRGRDWWVGLDTVIPSYLPLYLGLESSAREIMSLDAVVIPGILQTAGYAKAIIRAGNPGLSDREVARRVALRMRRRRETLDRADPPHLVTVLSEGAVRQCVGGEATHRAALKHLIRDRPTVEVRLLPYAAGAHAGTEGSFTVLSPPAGIQSPGCVYVENYVEGRYYDDPNQVSAFRGVLGRLQASALGQAESKARISEIMKGL